MGEEKMNEPKTTSPDELAKPKKPGDVQLNEQELGQVSGGARSDGGGATVGRAN